MDDKIRKAYADGLAGIPSAHILMFAIGGKTYSTRCNFSEDGLDTGCIEIDPDVDSHISANNPTKQCFTPLLSKENLPEGVTQTDILQVLSTKLKLILKPPCAELVDIARIVPGRTHFSLWRLLRGEHTLYEKYGYTSHIIHLFRFVVLTTRWKEIKDVMFETPDCDKIDLASIMAKMGTPAFNGDETIADYMQKIPYTDVDKYMERIRIAEDTTIKETIVGLILRALAERKGMATELPKFTICSDWDTWKVWDEKLVFVSFEPVIHGGRDRSRSGSRSRQDRKTRHARKKLKNTRTRKTACVYKY